MSSASPGRIIVGVDGSEVSLCALRWAREESELRGLGLDVVSCWHVARTPEELYPPLIFGDERQQAKRMVDAAVEAVFGADRETADLKVHVLEGLPSRRLLDLAEHDAVMVVVGCRGRGGVTGLLLGSVSQHLAERALCPVVIIHDQRGV